MNRVFQSKTNSGYVQALRKFAGLPALKHNSPGRIPLRPEDIHEAEEAANRVAEELEGSETLANRLSLTMRYREVNCQDIASKIKVSRSAVHGWTKNVSTPTYQNLIELCKALDVPESFMLHGDESELSADDTIGVRLGDKSLIFRDKLFSLVSSQKNSTTGMQEEASLSSLCRKSGGRFLVINDELRFVPWRKRSRSKRPSIWPEAVEAKIDELLDAEISTYQAAKRLQEFCMSEGLPCPAKITLYKRLEARN